MAISVDSLAGQYAQAAAGSQTSQRLENSLNTDLKNASDDELMDVCKEFEAYFTEQVFKAMDKMVPKSETETSAANSQLKDYYKSELIKQYAETSTEKNGLGIAQMLYEQMKRNLQV